MGPYEVVGRLGAGGMGEVYRARDARLRRDVALKVLHTSLLTPEHIQRLSREARAAGSLNHPNIVAVYDVGTEGSVPYVVSELLEGESLRQRLDRGPIPYRKALEYGIHIAHALAAAHDKGICHRDVKPGNVFLTADGRLKLLDFGLAKARRAESRADPDDSTASAASRPGHALGTAGYMAPEQVLGDAVDHRTDIFALGAVLYEMLTGQRAFHRSSPVETMTAVLKEDPADALEANPEIPAPAAAVVRRCLEKNKEERFQSARDLAFHLQQLELATSGRSVVSARQRPRHAVLVMTAVLAALAGGGTGAKLTQHSISDRPATTFQPLTFLRSRISGARFASHAVVYSQALVGADSKVWLTGAEGPESRSLGYNAEILAARGGRLALSIGRRFAGGERFVGTLAVVPIGGGTPKREAEYVEGADWDPSGAHFAVARSAGLGASSQLEYPIGKVLYRSEGSIHNPRVSADGEHVAFLEDPAGVGLAGRVRIVDREGRQKVQTRDWDNARGIAWAPRGDEVWFTAGEAQANRAVRAVALDGKQRVVLEVPGSLTLWDTASDGRVLLTRDEERMSLVGMPPGASTERDLSWFDAAGLGRLSDDGRYILFGDRFGLYLRGTDGSEPTKLGAEGMYADDLSPDGKFVLATNSSGNQLVVLPSGPGDARPLPTYQIKSYSGAHWFPDGERIIFTGREANQELRSYVQALSGGPPKPLTTAGTWVLALSPNGALAAAVGSGGGITVWPTDGGPPRPVPGTQPGDRPVAWTRNSDSLWLYRRGEVPASVYRLEIATGQRRLWKMLVPPDPAGVYSIAMFEITPDGDSYFYSYRRVLSHLFLTLNLR